MTLDERLMLRLGQDHLRALDEMRRAEPDLPSRAEMLRRLIERSSSSKAFMKIEAGLRDALDIAKKQTTKKRALGIEKILK